MTQQKWLSLGVSLLLAISFLVGVAGLMDHFARQADREKQRAVEWKLDDTVVSFGHRFNRLQWLFDRGKNWLEFAQERHCSLERLGQIIQKRLPFAEVTVFGKDGRILFPARVEGRRVWEKLWPHVLFLSRHSSSEKGDWQSPEAKRLFAGRFGPAALPTDFSHYSGKPTLCYDKVSEKISWVIPGERLTSDAASGSSGIWVLVGTQAIPVKRLATNLLREKQDGVDTVLILNKKDDKPVIEARAGNLPFDQRTARQCLGNTLKMYDRSGNAWAAFYIPGEFGRFIVAGVAKARLISFWTRHRPVLIWVLVILSLIFSGWVTGFIHPFGHWEWGLREKIVGFFLLTSIIPICSVWKFGFDRIHDTERLNRGRWEDRIKVALNDLDLEYLQYKENLRKMFEERESRLGAILRPDLPPARLQEALKENYEQPGGLNIDGDMIILDRWGHEVRYSRGDEHSESIGDRSEGRTILKKYLVRVVSMEGGKPPENYVSTISLISGKTLEGFLSGIERTFKKWKKILSGRRKRITRANFLRAPSFPHETLGFIAYMFWEEDFARPFIETWLNRPQGDIRFVAVSDENRISPRLDHLPIAFQHMLDRARIFQTREVEMLEIGGKPTLVMVWTPVHLGGYQLVGMVDAARIHEDGWFIEMLMRTTSLGGLLFLALAAILLSKKFLVRIEKLRHFVRDIIEEKFESRVLIEGNDELAMVATTFNEMAEGLQRRERLRRFVSDQVFQETKKSDDQSLSQGGTRCEAAVLFSHIYEFEKRSDESAPEDLLDLLNAYFTRMDDAIRAHGGSIDKLIGDAVMAVFFPAPDLPHPAIRAVLAAESMLKETAFLSAERQDEGMDVIRTDIGIHFGNVISGNIGAKTGRLDFTVIGDVVNTASRLVGIAVSQPEGSVVVSKPARRWLTDEVGMTPLPHITIRGKTEPLEIFALTKNPLSTV